MEAFKRLLEENKKWAQHQVEIEPDFFKKLENLQTPEFLWIGCSDSRVPANQITGTNPGEIFVHRNVANLVVNGDVNVMSVLQYSVDVLKVRHIIVCGHYGCGGVQAAMTNKNFGVLNTWLQNIKDIYSTHKPEIDLLRSETERVNRLVELNVEVQVNNLMKTTIIQNAWKRDKAPYLHGWVYSLGNGILKSVLEVPPGSPIDPVYKYEE